MRSILICLLLFAAGNGLARTAKYWVEFTDKGISKGQFVPGHEVYEKTLKRFSLDALLKREQLVNDQAITAALTIEDAPIFKEYLTVFDSLGLHILSRSRWSNAVSVEIPDSLLPTIKMLRFVKSVNRVRKSTKQSTGEALSPFILSSKDHSFAPQFITQEYGYDSIIYHYGASASQLQRTGVVPLHAMGLDATKVKIGFMDTGFRWEAMRSTKDRNIISEYDYIFRDTVVANESGDVQDQDGHGSVVLSSAVGFLPDSLIGAAYNAEILLAKTEDLRSETPLEEDYYVEAIENFESQGVRIASSSLGYMFYDSGYKSYTYDEMNGKTTISARAASRAAKLGMLCVSAMGNSGTTGYPFLNTPADADSILAVGALDVNDTIAAFSSRGPSSDGRIKPDVVAPGVKVWTMNNADVQTESGGTSLATPLVTGACALIMQAHPWANAQQVRSAVLASATQHSTPDNAYGYGRIDAYSAALRLGTLIGPHRSWYNDTVYTIHVGVAANNRIENPRIVYAYNVGGLYTNSLPLELITDSLIYRASFPALPKGTHVRYYIETSDGADTITRSPRNAPDSVYSFYVGDTIPSPPYNIHSREEVSLDVYPNPARDYVNVALPEGSEFIELRDALGRCIHTIKTRYTTKSVRFSLEGIADGCYLLYIRQKTGSVLVRKLLVAR